MEILRVNGLFWRVLSPRWAHAPLSGAGAARLGGRYNPAGMAALYMSEDLATAVAEYQQDLGLRPGTFCAYSVDVAGIVDLATEAGRAAAGVARTTLACPWREIRLARGEIPPTWMLVEHLFAEGHAGVRVPSERRPEGINLVVWRWNDVVERQVEALDPNRDLVPL